MLFDVIYSDNPWQYRNKKTGGSMISGAEAKYHTMPLDEICAIPVSSIAARDSMLFLWVPVPLSVQGVGEQVAKAWGFEPKTKVFWQKIMSLGMGYWFRGQVEELWVCKRGKVKAFRMQEKNWIEAKVGKHSEKPEEFRQLIERATAKMAGHNWLEMFATKLAPGWTSLGDAIDGKDIRVAIQELKEKSMQCKNCNQGLVPIGKHFISHEQASDAGYPELEGELWFIEYGLCVCCMGAYQECEACTLSEVLMGPGIFVENNF